MLLNGFFCAYCLSLMKQFQITKKKNSKLTHPLFLNSISMSRLENTWLSAQRLHCEEKRRSCQCPAFEVLGYCHLWQYPTTNQVVAPLVPLMVAWFKALLTPPCWQMCWRGSPCLPINEAIIWEQIKCERQRECVKRIERKGEELQWQQPCCHCSSYNSCVC